MQQLRSVAHAAVAPPPADTAVQQQQIARVRTRVSKHQAKDTKNCTVTNSP
jgi:hypothetical protein